MMSMLLHPNFGVQNDRKAEKTKVYFKFGAVWRTARSATTQATAMPVLQTATPRFTAFAGGR
jgi:hypothetical protein